MKAASPRLLVLAFALACTSLACGHKKPKEAKSSSSTAPAATETQRCEVKGFAYSVPEPGPIVDAREAGAP